MCIQRPVLKWTSKLELLEDHQYTWQCKVSWADVAHGANVSVDFRDKSKKFAEQASAEVCIHNLQMRANGSSQSPPELPYITDDDNHPASKRHCTAASHFNKTTTECRYDQENKQSVELHLERWSDWK